MDVSAPFWYRRTGTYNEDGAAPSLAFEAKPGETLYIEATPRKPLHRGGKQVRLWDRADKVCSVSKRMFKFTHNPQKKLNFF